MALNVMSLTDSQAQLNGSAVAGSGEYKLEGLVNLADLSHISGQLKLVGSNVALVHSETIHADGNVALVLAMQERNIDISGDIEIARGSIGAGQRAGVISESADVLILSETPKSKSITTTLDITVDMGKEMQINASGLTGTLTGKPRIKRSKNGVLSSTGNIVIADGKFAAYGQNLNISKGQASYSGGDLGNPNLSVEATRTIQRTTVGISVTGPAEYPEVRLFSEPAMSDQDILSYLVFGKPVDQINSADGLRLLSIANSLRGGSSTSQLDLVSDRIADIFGLQSVNLEFDASGNDPSLGIRSQLTSKLELGYGYNFISSVRTLFLRYKLTDNWSIQSNIDVESGADFRYQIERN